MDIIPSFLLRIGGDLMDFVDSSYKYSKISVDGMESKTVLVAGDLYALLVANKREDESLSDVIRRLVLGKKPKLSATAGLWKDIPAGEIKDMHKLIKNMRKSSTRRLMRGIKELS